MVAENRVEAAGVARRELKKASERLLLPQDVTDEATCIYKRSLETGLAKGRPLHCANRQLPVANVRSHTIVLRQKSKGTDGLVLDYDRGITGNDLGMDAN